MGVVVPLVEAESATDLVEGDELGELPGIHEEVVAEVLEIAVEEGLLLVEAEGNDVLGILHGEGEGIFKGQVLLEEGFFVVCQHEDEGHVEDILQPLCELERDGVAEVQAAGAGATAGVEHEGLAALMVGEDLFEVAVAEEEAATEPAMGLVTGDLFEALEEGVVDEGGVPFPGGGPEGQWLAVGWVDR